MHRPMLTPEIHETGKAKDQTQNFQHVKQGSLDSETVQQQGRLKMIACFSCTPSFSTKIPQDKQRHFLPLIWHHTAGRHLFIFKHISIEAKKRCWLWSVCQWLLCRQVWKVGVGWGQGRKLLSVHTRILWAPCQPVEVEVRWGQVPDSDVTPFVVDLSVLGKPCPFLFTMEGVSNRRGNLLKASFHIQLRASVM